MILGAILEGEQLYVSLEAGEYILVAEVPQSSGQWEMRVQIQAEDGTPTRAVRGLSLQVGSDEEAHRSRR